MKTARLYKRPTFDIDRISARTFVRDIDYHRTIPSTNTRALELAAIPANRLPVLVIAENQTAGRGRGANSWWSAKGALTFSLLLDLGRHPAPPDSWPRMALAAAVSVCEAMETLAPAVAFGIRWPNDVYARHQKICGILPELCPGAAPRLVLGIGINVNNSTVGAPEPLPVNATSLVDIAGRTFNLTSTLVEVLRRLELRLADLESSSSELAQEWSRRCLLRGHSVRLQVNEDIVEGHCMGIDSTGAIGIRSPRGIEKFYGGAVVGVGAANGSTFGQDNP